MMSLICTPSAAARYRIERDVHFARLLAGQKHLRNTRDLRQTWLHLVLYQFLIVRQVFVRIVGQNANQQRCRPWRLRSAAGADLRLNRIRRAWRRLCQVVDDVEFGGLYVGADSKCQVDEALTAADERGDVGHARRVTQDVFLRLDNVCFHLFRGRRPPEVRDRYLWLLDIGQQLDRQRGNRGQPEQGHQRNGDGDGRPLPGTQFGQIHKGLDAPGRRFVALIPSESAHRAVTLERT